MSPVTPSSQQSHSTDGASLPVTAIPSLSSRRAACTHIVMERLYGDFQCMVCHRSSPWGCVYSCAQDDRDLVHGARVVSTQATKSEAHEASASAELDQILILNSWVQKAILAGKYTPEEISILVRQKQNVNNAITASEQCFSRAQGPEPSLKNSAARLLQPVDANPYLPFPALSEAGALVTGTTERPQAETSASSRSRLFPHCRFRACQICRPIYRDRSWQIFESALEEQTTPLRLDLDYPDRPVSDARLVLGLGLPKSNLERPVLRTFGSSGIYSVDSKGELVFNTGPLSKATVSRNSWDDIAGQQVEPESKGFADSLRRALRSMVQNKKRDSPSRKHSRLSHRRTKAQLDESGEFDLGLYKELSEQLLREATNVALPGHDGRDGLEGEAAEEIEVEDGVAVTEEAVDLRTADIIMSV